MSTPANKLRRKRPPLPPQQVDRVKPAPDNYRYPRWLIERAFPDKNKRPKVRYREGTEAVYEKRI